jgi:ABC transporter ATM
MLLRRTSTLLFLNLRPCRYQRAVVGGISPFPGRTALLNFSTTRRTKKDQVPTGPTPIKAEVSQPAADAKAPQVAASNKAKQNAFLSEGLVSNAEQRKADWAIMREMTQYLWPKVSPLIFSFFC